MSVSQINKHFVSKCFTHAERKGQREKERERRRKKERKTMLYCDKNQTIGRYFFVYLYMIGFRANCTSMNYHRCLFADWKKNTHTHKYPNKKSQGMERKKVVKNTIQFLIDSSYCLGQQSIYGCHFVILCIEMHKNKTKPKPNKQTIGISWNRFRVDNIFKCTKWLLDRSFFLF